MERKHCDVVLFPLFAVFVETPWTKVVPVAEEVSLAGRGGDGGADHALEGGWAGPEGVLPATHQGGAGASVSPALLEIKYRSEIGDHLRARWQKAGYEEVLRVTVYIRIFHFSTWVSQCFFCF